MSLAATVKAMAAAGCSMEQVIAVVEAHEAAATAAIDSRRANDRERKQRQRHVTSREVTGHPGTSRDSADPSSPKERSPTPPKENTPPSSCSLRSHSSAEADEPVSVDRPKGRARAEDGEVLQGIAAVWNDAAPGLGLPSIDVLSPKRIASVRARIRELPDFGFDDPLAAFRQLVANIRGSPFLLGNPGPWRADFDFAVSPKGFTKIMENTYAGQQKNGLFGRH